jgi:ElaB/YqjD/DUF883 family membrane-anchored ribosome-binding protein
MRDTVNEPERSWTMTTTTASSEHLSEALKLLETAAKEKKDEIRNLVSDKYTHLKSALMDAEHSTADALSLAQKRAVEALIHAKQVGEENVKKAAQAVDTKAHENPWPFIGGTAVVALLFGYILGRKK